MIRRLILIAALLVAVPLSAQGKHRVSRIDVRGDVPARIVVSQSTLAEGRSYTDDDLELAVARVRRLPFVYDARYSLEGETLVLEVNGVTKLFGDLDASGVGSEGDRFSSAAVAGGGRLFLGSGVAEGRVQEFVAEHSQHNAAAEVAYSQYGIAGMRLFASACVNYNLTPRDGFHPDPTLRLLAGYPLTLRQTLTASAVNAGYTARQAFFLAPQGIRSSSDSQSFDLRWTYDTTDDPFFAQRGLMISAGPRWGRSDLQTETFFAPAALRTESTSRSLTAEARRLWTLGSRSAIFSGIGGTLDRTHVKSNFGDQLALGVDSVLESKTASVTLGYAHNLFDRARATAMRQRIELGATYNWADADNTALFDTSVTTINAAYVLRPQFATVRLSLSYVFQDRPEQAQQPIPPFPFN